MKVSGADLIEYLVKEFGPKVPQKMLQKLAYLAEVEYAKKHGERLSNLRFIRYYYGPYSLDIKNIEDESENIAIVDSDGMAYSYKFSTFTGDSEPDLPFELKNEIRSILQPYRRKTGKELEEIADKTEPFLETEELREEIDLDGYAWFHNLISREDTWAEVERQDQENEKKNVYGKVKV